MVPGDNQYVDFETQFHELIANIPMFTWGLVRW